MKKKITIIFTFSSFLLFSVTEISNAENKNNSPPVIDRGSIGNNNGTQNNYFFGNMNFPPNTDPSPDNGHAISEQQRELQKIKVLIPKIVDTLGFDNINNTQNDITLVEIVRNKGRLLNEIKEGVESGISLPNAVIASVGVEVGKQGGDNNSWLKDPTTCKNMNTITNKQETEGQIAIPQEVINAFEKALDIKSQYCNNNQQTNVVGGKCESAYKRAERNR